MKTNGDTTEKEHGIGLYKVSIVMTITVRTYAGFEAGTVASVAAAGSFFALGSRFLAADLEATGASSPESSSAAKKFDDWSPNQR